MKLDKKLIVNVVYALAAFGILTSCVSLLISVLWMSWSAFIVICAFLFALALACAVQGVIFTLFYDDKKFARLGLILKSVAAVYAVFAFILSLFIDGGAMYRGTFLSGLLLIAVVLTLAAIDFGYKDFLGSIKTQKSEAKPLTAQSEAAPVEKDEI